MPVRVGINGFGRIGRQSLKALLERALLGDVLGDAFIDGLRAARPGHQPPAQADPRTFVGDDPGYSYSIAQRYYAAAILASAMLTLYDDGSPSWTRFELSRSARHR